MSETFLLVMLTVIGIVAFILFSIGFVITFLNIKKILKKSRKQASKIEKIEEALTALLQGSMMQQQPQTTFYVSKDGKYRADSVPELLEAMAEGGDLNITDEEKEKFLFFFNTAIEAVEDVDFDLDDEFYDEDDEELEENWKG